MHNQYNLYATPNVYFDGGYAMVLGAGSIPAAKAQYVAAINTCGARIPWDIDMALDAEWAGSATMHIDLTVVNNAASQYNGYVRVFVVEKVASLSSWIDSTGARYTMAFLDFAVNESVSIAAGGNQVWSLDWDGALHNDGQGHTFDFIQPDNVMVIAAAFEGTGYQKYSYPPNTAPFTAYYLDESVGTEPSTPDLYVASFTSPDQADPGENVYSQIDLTIGNDGTEEALDFYVGLYISEDEDVTAADTLLVDGRVHVASLPAGGTANITFPGTLAIPAGLSTGNYYIGAVVDDGGAVCESEEMNNVLANQIEIGAVPKPDIKVNGLDGPLTVLKTDLVETTIGLDPGDLNGVKCDWWVYVQKEGASTWWAKYTPGKVTWTLQVAPLAFASAKLQSVGSFKVLKPRTVPKGSYVWTFSVDHGYDGIKDDTYMDQVQLTVIP